MCLNVGDLPPELLGRPAAFIALTGLDIIYNAVHRAIWEAFNSNRRSDRVPVMFKCLPGDHEYPKPKGKRTSYEWYAPKGILKKSWLRKHLFEVPSVVVIFYDLDWEEPQWSERLQELKSKTEVVRSALEGRNTRVAVVLNQKNVPLPPGEDMLATERAAAICSSCDLSAKSLFVLPHCDPLLGYVMRLENALFELAQGYYHTETRTVKNHRELLNKTNHQLLFVRHQFKMAVFNELRQDIPTALKQYKQAYANLFDIRSTDINLLEIKVIAGILNYKICRLSFILNTPLDAISQFRKHVDIFRNRTGPRELPFEHSAWMSKQFSIFGDLFDEAIKNGLTAIQTQHPGFYYQQAAYHAISRRKVCWKNCNGVEYPAVDPLCDEDSCEYYGQRPWRAGMHTLETPDAQKEREGIAALQHRELHKVPHSELIIPLLTNAVNQFKKFRCTRMQYFLIVQMAEEHFHARDYTKALSLLGHVQWDYREERWWSLLTHTISMALRCAYLVAAVKDYIILSIELISSYTEISPEEKLRIQKNLQLVLLSKPPEPEPNCPEAAVLKAQPLWLQNKTRPDSHVFTVEMNSLAGFVEIKVAFEEESFIADQLIKVNIYIKVSCPLPIKFSKLNVLYSNSQYNAFSIIDDSQGDGNKLLFQPEETRVLTFGFNPCPEDVNMDIVVNSIVLHLGLEKHYCAVLHWPCQQMDQGFADIFWRQTVSALPEFNQNVQNDQWKSLPMRNRCRLLPRKPLLSLTVNHTPPALINELYACTIMFSNEETAAIKDVKLSVSLQDEEDTSQSARIILNKDLSTVENSNPAVVSLKDALPGQQFQNTFYVQVLELGSTKCNFKIMYQVTLPMEGKPTVFSCEKEEEFTISSINPFAITTKVMNAKFETINTVREVESFILQVNVENLSPTTLWLLSSSFDLSSNIEIVNGNSTSPLENIVLNGGDYGSEIVRLKFLNPGLILNDLGKLVLSWRRDENQDIPSARTVLPLPSVSTQSVPVTVSLEIGAHGWVRTPLPVVYKLRNCTDQTQDIELLMDASETFMFAGYKQLHCRLFPQGQQVLTFNLYPLVPGFVALPHLKVVLTQNSTTNSDLDSLVKEMVPSHVFIMPRGKSIPDFLP